ncbi:O-antigen ligase family protein [Massilia glaciei]|uniref:O-antigen ligase domain-containing protein n=1 Tax=Massilia glaciei TaxID=1524097 RepID=A0A2U2HC40_9BURK|nr:hypothetical protein [Massilia glaciei]PWF40435.1 hypothetical protein C7C56_026025 [Massilia glaciei]
MRQTQQPDEDTMPDTIHDTLDTLPDPVGGARRARGARAPANAWQCFEYGKPRLFFVALMVVAAGIDVRTRDIGIGGPASNPLEALLLVAFALLLADAVVFGHQPARMLESAWRSNRFAVLYFGWAGLAGFFGIYQLSSLSFFVFRNLFPAFAAYVFLTFSVRRARDLRLLLTVFLIAAGPNLALGLSQYFFDGPFPVRMNAASAIKMDIDGTLVRSAVAGLFNHPNGLAIFLVPVLLTAFGLAVSRAPTGIRLRLFAGAVLAATMLLLYLSKAKGAWAWSLFGIMVLLAPRVLLAFRHAWVAHLLAVGAGIAALTTASLLIGGAFNTMLTRIELWHAATLAVGNDVFSLLFGSSQEGVWRLSTRMSSLQYTNAHNVFLNQAVYFGLPALVFYAGTFVWAVRSAQRAFAAAADPRVAQCARIALAVLLSMAGQYFFEPAAEASGYALEWLLFVGLAAATLRVSQTGGPDPADQTR